MTWLRLAFLPLRSKRVTVKRATVENTKLEMIFVVFFFCDAATTERYR